MSWAMRALATRRAGMLVAPRRAVSLACGLCPCPSCADCPEMRRMSECRPQRRGAAQPAQTQLPPTCASSAGASVLHLSPESENEERRERASDLGQSRRARIRPSDGPWQHTRVYRS
eukprot:scaffold139603_cov31-Tisochrysis_lutea.AAC.2